MIERTTVRLPEDLLNQARRKAAAEGRTLTSLIEDGLRAILNDSPKHAKRKRIAPRISKATGGLVSGVDLTNLWTLQEAEDLEFVRRLQRSE
jgi:hypothetical protein